LQVEGSQVRVTSLASGSSGNAYLVESGTTRILLDAGLVAPVLERYLRRHGVDPLTLSAIFVSHEHSDHLRGVGGLARRFRIPVVATAGTLRAGADTLGRLPEAVPLPPGHECRAGGIAVRTFALSHDAAEPVGFWVRADDQNVCICTDLGEPTPAIRAPLAAADLLVLEANHDLDRLWRGPYPPGLKRRIAGPHGHLANATAARLLRDLADDARPRTVWLAHLSQTNNTPDLALDTVQIPLAQDGITHLSVAVAERDRPSLVWEPGA
jgi:phosphoribosyl 1,2-cyclic phosphodiesterase